MRPWNPHGQTFHGEPIVGQVPVRVVVHGPPMTPQQSAMLHAAYTGFAACARLSIVRNPNAQGILPDGSRYAINCVDGVCTCTVWPNGTSDVPFDTGGRVFVGGYGGDWSEPTTMFTFTRRSGVLTYDVRSFLPFAEDHPFMEEPRDRKWLITPVYLDRGARALFNANNEGRFGVREYFFIPPGGDISRRQETLKVLPSWADFSHARKYPGVGYVAFSASDRKIIQDDGTVVFEAGAGDTITSVSFHPVAPRVVFVVESVTDIRGHGFANTVPVGESWDAYINETNDSAIYTRVIQRTIFPTYTKVRKELELNATGSWVEKSSTPLTHVGTRSTPSYDAEYVDSYLRTLHKVSGAVNYTKDVPFTSYRRPEYTWGGGAAELEAEYHHYSNGIPCPMFDVSGHSHTVSSGMERRTTFSGVREYHYFTDLFRSIDLQVDCAVTNNEWVDIDGERIYTIRSETEWSMTTKVERAMSLTNPGAVLADFGKHSGSAKMKTKCQRRNILCYDPATRFVCYIEEKEFEYQYQPSSSCAIMGMEKGEATQPLHEDLLLGENEFVPTGDPEYFLVMRLRGAEVLREKLQTPDTPSAVHSLRADMIPLTSIFLRPDVPEFPPGSITKDEYKRRLRILLCTGYQFFTPAEVVADTGTVQTREHRFHMHPYMPGRRFDDYILTVGAFSKIPTLEAKYSMDSTTLGGVLLLSSSGPFIFQNAAYVVDYNGVKKQTIPEFVPAVQVSST